MNKNKKVITTKKKGGVTLYRLMKLFYKFTNLPQKNDKDSINIGFTYPIDNQEFVVFLMDKWVAWKESILDKIPEGTTRMSIELAYRGFTLGEYKLVLSGKVKEEAYKNYRVFAYLYLTNQTEREYFTGINIRNESELMEGYLEAISDAVKAEIPILHEFLFKQKIPVNINKKSLQLHSYILGMSGTGKSTIIKNLMYNLQKESQRTFDKSLVLIEPHGDLSSEVIRFCLNKGQHKKRLIYLDPYIRDTAIKLFGEDICKGVDYTFTINPFQTSRTLTNQTISYLTQELSSAIFEILSSESTNQMQAVIEAAIETLLRKEGASLSDLKLLMDDEKNGELIAFGTSSPNLEVAQMMERLKTDKRLQSTKSSIYYRLQSLISDVGFRNLLVGSSTVDLEREMNSGKIIIFNLSKSKLGMKGTPAFGKLLIALIQSIALKRQETPESKRVETYVMVDEFQNFVTPSVNTVMTEARKFKTHMILANQIISQNMERQTKRAILGNSALKFCSKNESDSIEVMAKQMGNIKPSRFDSLPDYSFLLHDKLNKSGGITTVRVPDFLVHQQPPFFMKKEELKEVFKYLIFESGYYRKIEPDALRTPVLVPNPSPIIKEVVYSPKFDE